MTNAPPGVVRPGPVWLWVTAWGLQGAGLLLVEQLAIEGRLARLAVTGAIAAIPLIGLFVALSRRSG